MNKIILIFILLIFCSSAVTFATKGRTDSNGCHNSKKAGYHCHNSGYTPTYNYLNTSYDTQETRELTDIDVVEYIKEGKQCYNIKNEEDGKACYKIQGEGDIFTHDEVINKLKEKKNCNYFSKYKHNQKECFEAKKEIIVYSSVELRKITRNYSKCNNIRSFSKDYEMCKQEKINKEEKIKKQSKENKLQEKIDSINKKIESFYKKYPKKIESIGRKLSKIKEKLDKKSDKYILINAIDLKIKELVNNSKKKL